MDPWLGLDPMWVITSCIHEPSKFDYRPTSLDTFLGRFMFTLIFTLWVCFLIQVITCIDYIWLTLLLSLVTWCFIWLSSDDEKNYPLGYIIVSSSTSSRFPSGLHWYSCYSLGLKRVWLVNLWALSVLSWVKRFIRELLDSTVVNAFAGVPIRAYATSTLPWGRPRVLPLFPSFLGFFRVVALLLPHLHEGNFVLVLLKLQAILRG